MSVETAVSRVLAAERDVVEQLAASERRANDILREARGSVRALARHYQERISRLHADCAAKTRDLVEQLEQDAAERDREPWSEDDEENRLRVAIERVAREMTERDDAH